MAKLSHPFHIHIPADLWDKLRRLARVVNRRTIKEEALIAIENHVKANESSLKVSNKQP